MALYYESGLLLVQTQMRNDREAPQITLAREWAVIQERE
jgi:hypothetical protein